MHIKIPQFSTLNYLHLIYVFHYVISVSLAASDGKNAEIISLVQEKLGRYEEELQVKNYKGWKSIKIYIPPSISKEDVLKILSSRDDVLTLSLKRTQKVVEADVAYGPHSNILEKLSSGLDTELLCLDNEHGNIKYDHSPRKKSYIRRAAQHKHSQKQQLFDIPEERLSWKTLDENLQEKLDASMHLNVSSDNGSYSWSAFHSYDSIMMFSKTLAENYSSVEYITIGKTFEGRDLFSLIFSSRAEEVATKYKREMRKLRNYEKQNDKQTQKEIKRGRERKYVKQMDSVRKKIKNTLTRKERKRKGKYAEGRKEELNNKETKKILAKITKKKKKFKKTKSKRQNAASLPIIYIDAGIHAREWISSAVATYIANQLVNEGQRLLTEITIILIPMANPDGYEYSRNYDRQWRKNRVKTSLPGTWGVDLNRNWDKGWNSTYGSGAYPSMDNYRGPQAFSEAETQAMRDLALVYLQDLTFYLSLHSFTQSLLYPWGYTYQSLRNTGKIKTMARRIVQVLNGNGDTYDQGQSSHLLYLASGTSCDFMYDIGVPYAYTLELPYDDFVFPPEKIIPVAEDVWTSIVCGIAKLSKKKNAKSICALKLAQRKST